MEAGQILMALEGRGIRVEVVGDRLRLQPADRVPPGMLEAVRQCKTELLAELRRREEQNEDEISRLMATQGWVVVRCRALDGARVLWVVDGGTRVPPDLESLPRYTIAELARVVRYPELLKATHAVKVFFPGSQVVEPDEEGEVQND